MSLLTYRSNTEFAQAANGDLSTLIGSVTAYAPGGVVSTTSNANTIVLYPGHGFVVGSKFMRGTDTTTYSGIYTVASVANNILTISLGGVYSVVAGDRLINLGTDSGVASPNYDGSTVAIYATPSTTTAITHSHIVLLGTGFYEYWHSGLMLWELVFDAFGVPTSYNLDVGVQPEVSAVAFQSTISVAGTATMAAINASGTIAAAGAVTVGTTLGVGGATTAASVTTTGNILSAGGGVGYTTGSGGTVTQLTNKSTGVALSKSCGQITMNNAALNAGVIVSFVLTNTFIAATDILVLNHISGGTVGSYTLNAQAAAGSATINVRNATAGNLSEAVVIGFAVVKGVTS